MGGTGGAGGAGGGTAGTGAGGKDGGTPDGGTAGAGGTPDGGVAGAGGKDGGTPDGGTAGAGGGTPPACTIAWGGDLEFGTTQDDQILGLTIDADDNLIAAGYQQGIVGVTNIEPDGNSRGVVLEIRPNGTVAWTTAFDTPATETAEDVAVDPATGNLVVVGRTSGAFSGFVNQGQFDLFLALLAPGGQVVTTFQTGNERPQHPVRLSLAPGGQVFVAGWDDTYIPTNYVAANEDGFTASYTIDPGPGYLVTQTFLANTFVPAPTGPFSLTTGVAAEQDGSGISYVTTIVTTAGQAKNGIHLTQLLGNHGTGWDRILSPEPVDAVNAVALSPAGDLFVTGATFLTLGAKQFGQEDAFVAKIDKQTGAPIWIAQAGGADSDYPTALAFDAAGNIYIAGITLGSVAGGVTNQGMADVFAMKFSATGALLQSWQTGTSADDEVTSLAVDHCGRAFVGGYTGGALVPGHPSTGGEDMFVLQARF